MRFNSNRNTLFRVRFGKRTDYPGFELGLGELIVLLFGVGDLIERIPSPSQMYLPKIL